ncbi:hypothetical protein B0H17DRAFT_1130845 [Mycena rosella]|uniref:Uncharacterized protein n=1 Tax=Mycena rosella TaxID=1033263 RepID=A0AAD7DPM5_MYCRO|nr:hypothetical protein B0H17DRAFT_1130845 [Mycena rosella]
MKNFATTPLLFASVAVRARSSSEADGDCKVQAWVCAEDLAPDHISHSDLRIKVKPAHCADRVASMALRLQFDEFGEVKHLRAGAVLPEIEISDNQTVSSDFLGFYGGSANDIVYDYGAYDRVMNDPVFWVVKAGECRAWATEVVLFQNNPNFSKPMVAAFIVASPAVKNYRGGNSQPIRRHAFSQLGYHYIAVVEFMNGTKVELPAGHTTFVTTSPPPGVPFAWNMTLSENNVQQGLVSGLRAIHGAGQSMALGSQAVGWLQPCYKIPVMAMCDRILVVHDGRIAGQGTYEELMRRWGVFAVLVSGG